MSSVNTPNNALSTVTATTNERTLSDGKLVFVRFRDAWVTPTSLKAILATTPAIDWVKVPDSLDTVKRAIAAARDFRSARITGRTCKIDLLSEGANGVSFGILTRDVVTVAAEHRYLQRATVRYDATTDAWSWITIDPSNPVDAEITAFVAHCERWQRHFDYGWVRDRVFFAAYGRMGAFPVGTAGGVYFVPPGNDALLSELKTVASACGSSRFHTISIGADADSSEGVAGFAEEALGLEVAAILAKLQEWRDSGKGKSTSLSNWLGDLGSIRDRAAQLATVLRCSLSSVVDAIDEAHNEVESQLNLTKASKPKPNSKDPIAVRDAAREAALKVTPAALHDALRAAWAAEDAASVGQAATQPVQPEPVAAPVPVPVPAPIVPPAPVAPIVEQQDDQEEIPTVAEIRGYTSEQIKRACKDLKIRNWASMRTDARVAAIVAHYHGDDEAAA